MDPDYMAHFDPEDFIDSDIDAHDVHDIEYDCYGDDDYVFDEDYDDCRELYEEDCDDRYHFPTESDY